MKSAIRKLKISRKGILFFSFSFITIWTSVNAQELQKPSEKYRDAYKKYLGAACPVPNDSIRHFVYFARDREAIIGHPFLTHTMFKGAQIMYSWKNFETQKSQYDFSIVKEDYEYLKKYGKKLFIQIQDATFSPDYKAIPEYLFTDEYGGDWYCLAGKSVFYQLAKRPSSFLFFEYKNQSNNELDRIYIFNYYKASNDKLMNPMEYQFA